MHCFLPNATALLLLHLMVGGNMLDTIASR